MGLPASIRCTLSADSIRSEVFYGIWMVTAVVAAVSFATAGRTEAGEMLVIAMVVTVTWGLIDALAFIMAGRAEGAQENKAAPGPGQVDEDGGAVASALDLSVLRNLDEADKQKVLDMLAVPTYAGRDEMLSREDGRTVLAIFLVDVLALFPVVLPFLLLPDMLVAAQWSWVVATVSFAVIGHSWARSAGWRRNRTAVLFALPGIALIAVSAAAGF